MAKKTKTIKVSKSKGVSAEQIRAALTRLEEIAKSGKQVHVTVVSPAFPLRFQATIKKFEEGWYALSAEGFEVIVAPVWSEAILFAPDGGGLCLIRENVAVTIDPDKYGREEILAHYPDTGELIH